MYANDDNDLDVFFTEVLLSFSFHACFTIVFMLDVLYRGIPSLGL
jgi:hypothetical protein